LVKFEEADRITVARDGILSVILRNGILVMGMPLPNGLLRPTFHGVQNFLGPAQRDFVDFEFSNISEIQFAKRAASLAAAAVPLKPAERESLHMGIPVIVIADTPLWSHGKVVRFAQKGEILSVASYARGNTVELIDRNKRGDRLQVTASCDAIALTVPQT